MKPSKQNRSSTRDAKLHLRSRIPRTLDNVNTIVSPSLTTTLRYVDPFYVRSNSGANYLFYQFRANALFDPDPLILSGSVSGFKEWTQFYSSWRVKTHSFRMHIANQETFPILWGAVYTATNPVTLVASRDLAVALLENPMSTRANLLSGRGGQDRQFMQYTCDLRTLLGNPRQYEADINYIGTPTSDPPTILYCNLVIASPSAGFLPNGSITALTMEMTVEFFNRQTLVA